MLEDKEFINALADKSKKAITDVLSKQSKPLDSNIPKICANCIYYCSSYCRHPNSNKTDEQVSEDYSCEEIEILS